MQIENAMANPLFESFATLTGIIIGVGVVIFSLGCYGMYWTARVGRTRLQCAV